MRRLLRGALNTCVDLELKRNKRPFEVTVQRSACDWTDCFTSTAPHMPKAPPRGTNNNTPNNNDKNSMPMPENRALSMPENQVPGVPAGSPDALIPALPDVPLRRSLSRADEPSPRWSTDGVRRGNNEPHQSLTAITAPAEIRAKQLPAQRLTPRGARAALGADFPLNGATLQGGAQDWFIREARGPEDEPGTRESQPSQKEPAQQNVREPDKEPTPRAGPQGAPPPSPSLISRQASLSPPLATAAPYSHEPPESWPNSPLMPRVIPTASLRPSPASSRRRSPSPDQAPVAHVLQQYMPAQSLPPQAVIHAGSPLPGDATPRQVPVAYVLQQYMPLGQQSVPAQAVSQAGAAPKTVLQPSLSSSQGSCSADRCKYT